MNAPDLAERGLSDLFERVAFDHHCTVREIQSPSRLAHLVEARRAAALTLRRMGWSLPAIGRALNRDHTTIISLLDGMDVVPLITRVVLDWVPTLEGELALIWSQTARGSEFGVVTYATGCNLLGSDAVLTQAWFSNVGEARSAFARKNQPAAQ